MAKISNGSRTLLVNYALQKLSDTNHYLSREELIEMIEKLGGHVSNNTIKADIDAIGGYQELKKAFDEDILNQDYFLEDYEIEIIKKKGTTILKHQYTNGELVYLYKLIENSYDLTQEEKQLLMNKILTHTSIYNIELNHLSKPFDEAAYYKSGQILENMTSIQEAIANNKCLKFLRYIYKIDNGNISKELGDIQYYIYPIRFEMKNHYLYLLGYDLKSKSKYEHTKFHYYKIDNMINISVINKSKKLKDIYKHDFFVDTKKQQSNQVSDVLKRECIDVKLKVHAPNRNYETLNYLLDKHYYHAKDVYEHKNYVELTLTNIEDTDELISKIFRHLDDIEILEPEFVREKVRLKLEKLFKYYNK